MRGPGLHVGAGGGRDPGAVTRDCEGRGQEAEEARNEINNKMSEETLRRHAAKTSQVNEYQNINVLRKECLVNLPILVQYTLNILLLSIEWNFRDKKLTKYYSFKGKNAELKLNFNVKSSKKFVFLANI